MRRWPLLLLAGLLLLQKRPGDAYAVVPRSSCSRALLQKDVDDEKTNVPPGGANKRPPRFPPDDDPADFPPRVAEMLAGYLDNKALTARLHAIASRCTSASARAYTIGSSVRGEPLTVLELTVPPPPGVDADDLPLRAHVQYTGALHGDEPTGRQLLLALAEYICTDVEAAESGARDEDGGRRRLSQKDADDGGGGDAAADDLVSRHPGAAHHGQAQRGDNAGPQKEDADKPPPAQPAKKKSKRPAGTRDPRVAALGAAAITLHLLPAANPDGFAGHRRENAAGVDLNRDFPDPLDRAAEVLGLGGTPAHRLPPPSVEALTTAAPTADLSPSGKEQPETAALMAWLTRADTPFTAAAALHEGAVVANYPWDGTPEMGTRYAACPDDATFKWAATEYARRSPGMVASLEFASSAGITNGAAWYPLRGGMQDWAYLAGGALELTLELSDDKWPPPARLPALAADNWASLLEWPVAVVGGGARGRVVVRSDADAGGGGGPLGTLPANTTVRLAGVPGAPPVRVGPHGGFARPLAPGTWTLTASAPGGWTSPPVEVSVPSTGGEVVLALNPPPVAAKPTTKPRPPPTPARSPSATFAIAAAAIAKQRAGAEPESGRGGGGGLSAGGGPFGPRPTALLAAQSAFAVGAGLTLVIVVRSAAAGVAGIGRGGAYGGYGSIGMVPV